MELQHEFTVPVPVERAWEILNDVEGIAPCMPGAVVDEVRTADDGKVEVDGRVKVKLGPIQVTYRGTATFLEADEAARRLVVKAAGKETRGSGTANATITAQLIDKGDSTSVAVTTDLAITGKPAQFARGVMVDVSQKLLGQFVDCLSAKITAPPEPLVELAPEPVVAPGETAPPGLLRVPPLPSTARHPPGPIPPQQRPEPEAIDLLGTAGSPVLKRLAPVVAVVAALVFLLKRRRS